MPRGHKARGEGPEASGERAALPCGCTSDVLASGVLASDVAAPAGADNSRPSSPPKALPRPFRHSFRLSPRQQPQPHRRAAHPTESAATAAATSAAALPMCAPPVCLPPMWLRLQARTIHARPPRRRPYPDPSDIPSDFLRGYSRSHTGALLIRPNPRLQPQPHQWLHFRCVRLRRAALRCGCACRRGQFTPVLPAEGPYPAHPKFLPTFSAAAAAATPESCSSDRIRGYSRSHIIPCEPTSSPNLPLFPVSHSSPQPRLPPCHFSALPLFSPTSDSCLLVSLRGSHRLSPFPDFSPSHLPAFPPAHEALA